MVQVDISQLSTLCNSWKAHLTICRDEFIAYEYKLQQIANHSLTKEQLQTLSYLHNQLLIQLINLRDLKQSITAHDRKINFEKAAFNGKANEDSLARHEALQVQYLQLQDALVPLRQSYAAFVNETK
jgi:hypothetical protein